MTGQADQARKPCGYRYHIPEGSQLNGPCLYLKTNTGYAGREIKCGNKYHHVCKWRPHECPAGTRFNRKLIWLEFRLEKRLEIPF